MNTLYVAKQSHTFTDAIECIGLASIAEEVLKQLYGSSIVTIEDKGPYYQITFNNELNEEVLSRIQYFDLLPCIMTKKNKGKVVSNDNIDYEEQKENRQRYYDLKPEERVKDENPPPFNYDVIRLLANVDGYWKTYANLRAWKEHFSELLTFIFKLYEKQDLANHQVLHEIDIYSKKHKILIQKMNALQDINPDKGKGVNQKKANGIALGGQSAVWLDQLIRFKGVWKSCLSCYFDKDYKTYSLVPHSISTKYMYQVHINVKKSIKSSDSIKTDIMLLNRTAVSLIRYYPDYEESSFFGSPDDKISGLQYAYYKNLGNKPAVVNIGFLAIPNFIIITSKEEGDAWIDLLDEHQNRINSIDSKEVTLLTKYRQFLSEGNYDALFEFIFDFSSLLIREHNQSRYFLKPFTIANMEVLMETKQELKPILDNKGFRAVAEAIRNSTIIPTIFKNKKDIIFGLSNRFKISSRNSDSLIEELTQFINQYNERLMLKDFHQKEHKRYITTENIDDIVSLFDQGYSAKLIAGLLVAYGYARDPKKDSEQPENKEV